jgi:hypothetical protein
MEFKPSAPQRPSAARITGLVVALACAGCSPGDPGSSEGEAVAARDTVGDTLVVRTLSGSAWGNDVRLVEELRIGRLDGSEEYTLGQIGSLAVDASGAIYVVDQLAPALRKYAPDGTYVATFARAGAGPGEVREPDAGLAILPDGRLLVRDPGNSRISVYSLDGEYLDEWRIRGGSSTSRRLFVDPEGRALQPIFEFADGRAIFWLVRYGLHGEPGDTLTPPRSDREPVVLVARTQTGDSRSMSSTYLPFSPSFYWTYSQAGYFVSGDGKEYRITLHRENDLPVRIEREIQPVPVSSGERSNYRERVIASLRRTDPNWRWDGPAIPNTKPPFSGFWTDDDGRIWVRLHTRGKRVEVDEPDADQERSNAVPPLRWREPFVADVFQPDGSYLGQVRLPERFQTFPQPVSRGRHIWGVELDELDVPYIVRYRIVIADDATAHAGD